MGKWFGTDGIRGVANRDPMTVEMAVAVGRAVASTLGERPRIAVGMDTRRSGPMLRAALAAGICSAGGEVLDLGVVPTPAVALLVRTLGAQAGVVISASHNAFPDNGIKLFSGEGRKLPDATESAMEAAIEAGPGELPTGGAIGGVTIVDDAARRYVDFLVDAFPRELAGSGTPIVLDCANGATFAVAAPAFEAIGADVTVIHASPDGVNINVECGSQHTADLSAAVRERGARLGLAFDGDGDRLIAVDERGETITGDQILAVLSRDMKARGCLPGDIAVSTVMSNLGLRRFLEREGIRHVTTAVGDRYVREAMDETGAAIGGEDSGHMILAEHHTTGDGVLTGLALFACMLRADEPLSALASAMTVFPQRLVNIPVTSKPDLETLPDVQAAIARVEADFGDDGRVLVRYSGTELKCRVMVEGPAADATESAAESIAAAVRDAIG